MRDESEIRDKINELKEKSWKDAKEESKLRLVKVNGQKTLNPDRLVEFTNWGCLDIYNAGRFHCMQDVLEWALESPEKGGDKE